MTEEVKVEDKATDAGTKEATPVEPTVELSPVEQKALEQGWVPQDQWQGDPEAWRPAKEFVERGELYKSIHSTKRELKQTQAALQAQMRHHELVFQKAYEKAYKELRDQKRQAMKEQDFDQLQEVEAKIENLQVEHQQEAAQLQAAKQVASQPAVAPEFQAFLDKNPWYTQDPELNLEADLIGSNFIRFGGSKDQLFNHVEKEIRKRHPDKFGLARPKVAAPSAVAAPSRKAATKGELTINDVPEHMKEVIENFAASSGISKADYIKELKRIGAI